MFDWWGNVDSLLNINGYASILTLLFAFATIVLAALARFFLRRAANTRMSVDDIPSNGVPGQEVNALKRAAGEMRKELLETQQNRDVMEQLLKSAEADIRQLKNELAKSRKKVASAEKTANQAAKTGNKQQSVTDNATVDIEVVEETQAVGLTVSQRHQLMDLLEPGPKGNIDIVSVLDNDVSEQMARELDDILSESGWTTNGVSPSAFSNTPKGIVVSVHSKDTAPTYALFLQRTLSVIGLPASGSVNRKVREWSLMLVVGEISPSQ